MPWLTLSGSNYPCLEQISIVTKMLEPLRFDWIYKTYVSWSIINNIVATSEKLCYQFTGIIVTDFVTDWWWFGVLNVHPIQSISAILKRWEDDNERLFATKRCQSWAVFHLLWDSNLVPHDPKSGAFKAGNSNEMLSDSHWKIRTPSATILYGTLRSEVEWTTGLKNDGQAESCEIITYLSSANST